MVNLLVIKSFVLNNSIDSIIEIVFDFDNALLSKENGENFHL